jgi:xanthine dehydrogenase accessory factor
MQNIFFEIVRLIEEKRSFVMATIIRQTGSAPRQTGTRCLVLDNNALVGTIGGGRLEFDVISKAGDVLRTGKSALLELRLSGQDVAQTEMICGGSVDVYLEPIFSDQTETTRLFKEIAAILRNHQTGALLTRIIEGTPAGDASGRLFIKTDGTVLGDPDEWAALPGYPRRFLGLKAPRVFDADFTQPVIYAEPIVPDNRLYVFGAGHISTFLAPLAQSTGFAVWVLDDRAEFANTQRFPNVTKVLAVPFEEAFSQVRVTSSAYIVIVTRGHADDLQVLREALRTQAGYIGMIGSHKKRDLIYDTLRREGVSEARLNQVYSPIGLPIGAQTPEQISVSIVAELIQVSNQLKKIF